MLTVMILAAGRGERLLPLTRTIPKPLMSLAANHPPASKTPPTLIERHIQRLQQAGFSRFIINLHHLGEQIRTHLGDGTRYNATFLYSHETQLLDTAGGIANALPLIGEQAFALISADVVSDVNVHHLAHECLLRQQPDYPFDAHLLLGDNPPHHLEGDVNWHPLNGQLLPEATPETRRGTFLGMGVFRPQFFAALPPGRPQALRPLLQQGILAGKITARWHHGAFFDCGTPARLDEARSWASNE